MKRGNDETSKERDSSSSSNVKCLHDKIEAIKGAISMTNGDRPELWIQRQNLQDLYHQVILSDIDYTIDKKLEQDLWNLVFKSQINYFQSQIKESSSKSNNSSNQTSTETRSTGQATADSSSRSRSKAQNKLGDAQTSLVVFLESARGFYTKLLEDLIIRHRLNEQENDALAYMPFAQRFRSVFEQISIDEDSTKREESIAPLSTKEKQLLYIFQHILTHLGDIARYAKYYSEAQNYYLHATKLVPYLGQPYNQLGILFETIRTNQLAAVFYYTRSIAVRYTFPLAAANLENFYLQLVDIPINRYSPAINMADVTGSLKLVGKLAHKDLLTLYLQINAICYTCLHGKSRSNKTNSASSNYNNNSSRLSFYFDLFRHSFAVFVQSPSSFLSQLKDKIESTHFSQMIAIVLFSLAEGQAGSSSSSTSTSTSSNETNVNISFKKVNNSQLAKTTSLELFVFMLEQFVYFYALHNGNKETRDLSELVLPGLYLAVSFIEDFDQQSLLSNNKLWTMMSGGDESAGVKVAQFCASTVRVLNLIEDQWRKDFSDIKDKSFSLDEYQDYPLAEDRMLDSFLPLKDMQASFSFRKYANSSRILDNECESILRRKRIVDCMKRIVNSAKLIQPPQFFISLQENVEEQEITRFELISSCHVVKPLSNSKPAAVELVELAKKSNDKEITPVSVNSAFSPTPETTQKQRKRRINVALESIMNDPMSIVANINKPALVASGSFDTTNISNPLLNQAKQNHHPPITSLNSLPLNNNRPLMNNNQFPAINNQQQPSFFPSASTRQFNQADLRNSGSNCNNNLMNFPTLSNQFKPSDPSLLSQPQPFALNNNSMTGLNTDTNAQLNNDFSSFLTNNHQLTNNSDDSHFKNSDNLNDSQKLEQMIKAFEIQQQRQQILGNLLNLSHTNNLSNKFANSFDSSSLTDGGATLLSSALNNSWPRVTPIPENEAFMSNLLINQLLMSNNQIQQQQQQLNQQQQQQQEQSMLGFNLNMMLNSIKNQPNANNNDNDNKHSSTTQSKLNSPSIWSYPSLNNQQQSKK